jgi:hypothetical protein
MRRGGIRFKRGAGAERGETAALRGGLRLRKRQGGLFADGSSVLHLALLSNIWDWEPVKLIEWHREKAGTIEGAHDVLKNELATGALPSKYFWGQRRLVTAGGDLLQCADGPEAFGVARRFIACPPEATAISDLLHGGSAGASRPTDELAAGQGGGRDRPVVGSPAIPTFSYLTRTQVAYAVLNSGSL